MTTPAGRIVANELATVFGGNGRAVDPLSFTVEPGSVTEPTTFPGVAGQSRTVDIVRLAAALTEQRSGD